MSSSSSLIELTILSVKLQGSQVHHAASHVYVKRKKQQKNALLPYYLSFNLVKVQLTILIS